RRGSAHGGEASAVLLVAREIRRLLRAAPRPAELPPQQVPVCRSDAPVAGRVALAARAAALPVLRGEQREVGAPDRAVAVEVGRARRAAPAGRAAAGHA